ncbi:atrial natriuretic peptide receptor 1-like [Mytilus edulis]|uniref:atrial natriuretic peptide receptor 1-like n=1 Tax=Mytilus edulis TaxID=6550 RepID=UPI0039EE2D7C
MRYFLILILSSVFIRKSEETTTVKIGVLLMTSAPEPFDQRRVGPALDIAFERAEAEYGVKYEVIVRNYTGNCPKQTVIGYLSELYYIENVKAVIGPACSETIEAAGRLAQYLEMPMISGVGDLVIRKQKDMYTTFTRMSYNLDKLSVSVKKILEKYSWKHIVILYDTDYVFFNLAGNSLARDFKADGDLPRPVDIPFRKATINNQHKNLLTEANLHARVFVIFSDSDVLRDFLYAADELSMTEGDHVFITMELFPSDWLGYYTQFLRGDYKDAAVTKAYESLLLLTPLQPDNIEHKIFSDEVKLRAQRDYGYTFGVDEVVNYFITAFYDGAIYLTEAINRTVEEGGDLNDGLALSQKLWNDTYMGITGLVAIDHQGDRLTDFDIYHMTDSATKAFKLVGRFRGATSNYEPIPGVSIQWRNGLPLDTPVCGFRGEWCVVDSNSSLTFTVVCVLIVLLVIGSVAFFFIYRKIKLDNELGQKTWLVPWSEVRISKHNKQQGSLISMSRMSLAIVGGDDSSQLSINKGQLFTQVGVCKGNTVAIRRFKLKTIVLTRHILLEFQQLQHLHHQNLCAFIGATIEPGNNTLLMEYCPRGSLQDILENDDIELDWTFRYSLLRDIIGGMTYLHDSPAKFHGRLSSTNCVIDSRFMLKLTDYGPFSIFNSTKENQMENNQLNKNKLLWTAPEILRNGKSKSRLENEVYVKGDIYSFGIICHEIVMRCAPFEGCDIEAEEILTKVMAPPGIEGPFRPQILPDSCPKKLAQLIERCWDENPVNRTSFKSIGGVIRKISVGKDNNILDNLMKRMELYANNLESLVNERTRAYMEEKKRAEDLLHRLLPPYVADKLSAGNSVEPESFSTVSIYFSDIVGFTVIASMSTPLQVVDLLNDLYICFDTILAKYDVYKVETIGDAYMVVSGLPVRNGNNHIREISNMALDIRHKVVDFKFRHLTDRKLEIRIGLHSGPVVAGVVGLTMPRYCLFGDSVNTASRMESTSEAMKIQMSQTAKDILDVHNSYVTETRGVIHVKGKGDMVTHWLIDKKKERRDTVIQ